MTIDAVSEKKKKQSPRRRWRVLGWIIGIILLISAAGALLQPLWLPYVRYQEAMRTIYRQEKFYSPDGRRFAITSFTGFDSYHPGWLVDEGAGKAHQLGYPENSFTGVQWSADSRFALLGSSTHYGSGHLTVFDMERGQIVNTPHPCGMFPMSSCVMEAALAIAPVSPLIVSRKGDVIHLPDGSYQRLFYLMRDFPVQVVWSPSEQRLFVLGVHIDLDNPDEITLVGIFSERDGQNPVQALSVDIAVKNEWYQQSIVTTKAHNPALCAWNADESGVECRIDGQTHNLIDPESK